MKTTENTICGRVIEQLDPYMDHELPAGVDSAVAAHLDACEACRNELATRMSLRDRVRSAVRDDRSNDELRARVAATIEATPAPMPGRVRVLPKLSVGVAAALVIGGIIAYQLGHLRWTTASQERYIAAISQRVGAIMRVGLGDHVHCAVFRKYPTAPPPPAQIAADMGPEFVDLVDIVREHLTPGQRVVMAHRCSYHQRRFVHIAMVDGKHLSSLVIAMRQPGENFNSSTLLPALSDPALPVYHAGVQRFQIIGFQTSAYLVYLISDLPRAMNEQMFAKLSHPVRDFLLKRES
jgi:anti-sigma factor (TIGR02949 family)